MWFQIHILKHRSRSYTLPFWLWEAQVVLGTIISSPAKAAVAPTLPESVVSGSRCSSSLVLQDLQSSINHFWEKKRVNKFIHVLQHTLYLLSTFARRSTFRDSAINKIKMPASHPSRSLFSSWNIYFLLTLNLFFLHPVLFLVFIFSFQASWKRNVYLKAHWPFWRK